MRLVVRSFLAFALLLASALPALAQEATDGEVVRLYVGPEKIDCVGVAPQKCLLVTTDPTAPVEAFYDPIAGFEHEDGTAYVIDVLVEPVENPPADASSLSYTLVDVVAEIPGGDFGDFETPEVAAPTGETRGDFVVIADDAWCELFHRGLGSCVETLPMTTSMGGLLPESWVNALGAADLAIVPDADFCMLLSDEVDACVAVIAPAEPPIYIPSLHALYTLADYLPPAD
jgi:hypothetical protein